jgi:hypothetical protein
MSNGDNRSVTARDISNSSIVTGDHNKVTNSVTVTRDVSVDLLAEIQALRRLFEGLQGAEAGKLSRALDDAEEEAKKPEPDPAEIEGAVGRALKYAKGANDFAEQIEKAQPRLEQIAKWIGVGVTALMGIL